MSTYLLSWLDLVCIAFKVAPFCCQTFLPAAMPLLETLLLDFACHLQSCHQASCTSSADWNLCHFKMASILGNM